MFYDDCGNEFKTIEDVQNFARKEFYNLDEYELAEIINSEVTATELLAWILKNDKEKFMKDYKNVLEWAEDNYVNDYFMIHDVEAG